MTTEAAASAGQDGSAWRAAVLAMAVAQFAAAFPARLIPTLGPEVTRDAGLPEAAVGYLASLGMLGFMILSLAATPFIVRFGPARSLQGALLFGILAMILAPTASLLALAAASLLAGMADGPTSAAANRALQRSVPERRRSFAFSLKMVGGPLGGMAAGLALPLTASLVDWRWGAAVCAGVVLAAILVLQPLRPALDGDRDSAARISLAGLAGTDAFVTTRRAVSEVPLLRSLLFAGAFLSFAQGCWNTFLVTFAVGHLNIDLAVAGMLLSASLLAGVTGRVAFGHLADRIGTRSVLCLLSGVAALVWMALAVAGPHWPLPVFGLLAVVGGSCIIGWLGLQHAEIARIVSPGAMTAVSAAAVWIGGLGFLLSGATFALLVQCTGSYSAAFMVLALSSLATALMLHQRSDRPTVSSR